MKKTISLLSIFIALAATSCKKDYICSCTYTTTQPGASAVTFEETYKEVKKSDAANKCVKMTRTSGGFTETMTCELK